MGKQAIKLVFLLLVSVQVLAATTYEFDWEVASPSAANVRNPTDGYWYHGNCFAKSAGDLFNSIELSTKYARIGSKSIRKARQSLLSNSQGHNNCESFLKSETIKHRNEIRYGYGKGVGTFENWVMGAERWFRMSVYIPSDEGNFSTWNASTKRIMLAQWIGTEGADHSHEVSLLLTGGPKIVMDGYYGISATAGATEYGQTFGEFNLKKDAWNDIIVRHRRSWQTAAENPSGHGIVQAWVNCADWAACTPVVDYAGRAAIRNKSKGWFKHGLYADISTWDHQHVIYSDAVKMGIRAAETDAQMLAEMADDFVSGGGTVDPPVDPPVASDLVINAGAAITSSQDPINFTVSGVNDITNCTMGGATQSAGLPVKFDYTTGTSGKFVGASTSGFTSSGTVKCYDESYVYAPDVGAIDMANSGTTDSAVTNADNWGYTKAKRIVKSAAGTGYAHWGLGVDKNVLVNDVARFDVTYSCTGSSCQNMLFDVYYSVPSTKTIRLGGTAGALVLTTTADAVHGTNIQIRNYTMPDNTYRVVGWWKALEATSSYRVRAGWGTTSAASLTMDMHEVVMRKNWNMRVLEVPVTYTVPDITPPTIPSCTLTNTLAAGDGTSGYMANINCTATEIGGTDHAIIKTSSAPPVDAAAVVAGAGGIWSAAKPAATSEIVFEASGMAYQDLWTWVTRCDTSGNCATPVGASFDAPVKTLLLGTVDSLIRHGGVAVTDTIDTVVVWDGNPVIGPSKAILAEFENVSVSAGLKSLTEADIKAGSPSLNGIPAGLYWVTTTRINPDTGVLSISNSQKAIVLQ